MTDTRNGKRLRVLDGGDRWLYIRVAADQLDQIRNPLSREGITHRADTFAVSLNGRPAVTVISLGLNNGVERVQAILDAVD